MDVANIARFVNRIVGAGRTADDTSVTVASRETSNVERARDGSLERLAVTVEGDAEHERLSGHFLEVCARKLDPRGWLWLHSLTPPGVAGLRELAPALGKTWRRRRHDLSAAGFTNVSAFAFAERGSSTKSCLWIVPLDTASDIPCAGAALGMVVPWKIAVARRPWFWRCFAPQRGYLARSTTDTPAWLGEIQHRVECYYTTRWRISAWHRCHGRIMVRDVFFPVETTHDNIRRFWSVLESVPPQDRRNLGLEDYSLTDRGDLLWIDRPLLQAGTTALGRSPQECSHDEVVAFVGRLHEVTPLGQAHVLSLDEVIRRITEDVDHASTSVRGEVERIRRLAADVSRGIAGSPVLQHGDMVTRNLVVTADGVKAFDWWAAKWVNFAGQDAVSFHYVAQRGPGTRAQHAHHVARRLVEDDPDPALVRILRAVRADIDWRAATLAYLVTLLAHGMAVESDARALDEWTSAVVGPTLDLLEPSAAVRDLRSV